MKVEYLGISILTSSALIGVGFIISYALRLSKGINSASDLLLVFTVGLLSVITSYSLIQTSFTSISLILLIILGIAYYFAPKISKYESPEFNVGIVFLHLGVFFLFYLLIFRVWDEQEGLIYHLDSDHHLLANISYYMNITGEENEFHVLNLFSDDYHGLSPYHYSELWLNSVISELWRLNYDLSLFLVLPALFYFPVYLAFSALSETIGLKNKAFGMFLSSCFVFFFGSLVPIDFLNTLGIPFLENLSNNYVFAGLKHAPYLLFILLFFIFWLRDNRQLAYLSLIFMSIVQFTSIPAVFGFLLIWFIFFGIYKKNKEEKIALFCMIGVTTSYLLLKSVYGNSEVAREATTFGALIHEVLNIPSHFVQRINIFIKSFVYLFLDFHLIWIMVLMIFIKSTFLKANYKPIIVLSGVSLSGLLMYALLFEVVNSDQLFNLIVNAFIPILFFYIVVWSFIHKIPSRKLFLAIMVLFLLPKIYGAFLNQKPSSTEVQTYSKEYLYKIDSVLNSRNFNVVGASFRNNYGTEYSSYVTIYTNGTYLSQLKNGACTISMSDLDIQRFKDPLYQKRSENGYKLGLLFRRIEDEKKTGNYISYQDSQLKLLIELNCEYAIFSKDYIMPSIIQAQIKTIFIDEKTGEKFALLNKKTPHKKH